MRNLITEKDKEKSLEEINIKLQGEITHYKLLEKKWKEKEKELLKENAFNEAIIENFPGSVLVFDEEWNRIRWSKRTIEGAGYTEEEIKRLKPFDFFHPEDIPRISEKISEVMAKGVAYSLEANAKRKNGTWSPNLYTGVRVIIDNSPYFVAVGQDITKQKKIQEELGRARDFSESLINSLSGIFYLFDNEGKLLQWNKNFEDVSEYSSEEMSKMIPIDFIVDEDKETISKGIERTFVKGKLTGEASLKSKSGKKSPFYFTGSLIVIDDKPHIIGTAIDISARKKAEEELKHYQDFLEVTVKERTHELKKSNSELDQIFNTVFPMYVIDKNFKIIKANDTFCSLFHLKLKDIIGQKCYDVWQGPLCHTPSCSLKQVLGGKGQYEYEIEKELDDDTTIICVVNSIPYLNPDGEIVGNIKALINITERKQAEKKLKEISDALKRSNEDLEQFTHVISHDLREPLRTITSYVQLLVKHYKDKLDQNGIDFINYAVSGAKRMNRLIQDLLAFSRVGTQDRAFEWIDCEKPFEKVLLNLQIMIKEKGTEITCDPLPNVMGDFTQLMQLFQNLIENSIKFSSGDNICRIHVSARKKEDYWIFAVKDNGIGIDPVYFKKVFIIFQRLHSREEYSGSGIGLTICKKIVQRHGGTIWVESELGKGSTFYFSLPIIKKKDLIELY